MKTVLISTLLAVSAASLIGSPASAETLRTRTALAVSTAGLDLSTERGVRTLDLRILHAASELCGTPSLSDARGRIKLDACRAEARAAAALQRDQILAAAERRGVRIAAAR
jgi:UrcA family protein